MPRHKKGKDHGATLHRKSRIRKRTKLRTLRSISRKGQPSPIITVPRIEKGVSPGGSVASSWISALQWDNDKKVALMYLINGYFYSFKIPFKLFEQWYYATSKGTFFNSMIKDKFAYKRLQ